MFFWYHVHDGVATVHEDTPAIRKRVDTEPGWYGNAEGPILHGGVLATAFTRKTEPTYDAAAWLFRGERVPMGEITTTTITAEPKGG
jgi:hypothetical protein